MKKIIQWILPIKTISEANCTQHWTKKNKRHQIQKKWIGAAFDTDKPVFPERVHVKMTRISGRKIDDDNNVSCFKYIRDAIADRLNPGLAPGQADSSDLISWSYYQEKGKVQMVKIEIFQCDQLRLPFE